MMIGRVTFLLPILVAGTVWYFTGSEIWGGVTFTVFWIGGFIFFARKFEQNGEDVTHSNAKPGRINKWVTRTVIFFRMGRNVAPSRADLS
jgi:hypothetical protein